MSTHVYVEIFMYMCVCGGLNEHGPHRHIYFNVWSLVRRTIWEGFGELEVFHWGHVLKFQRSSHSQLTLCLWLSLQATAAMSCLLVCYYNAYQ